MILLTSLALDPENAEAVREVGLPMGGSNDPLTKKEWALLSAGGKPIMGIPHADLHTATAALYHNSKYLVGRVEFHFRNDATRHLWGDPVTFETELPDRESQLAAAQNALKRLAPRQSLGILAGLQPDEEPTQDRHVLWVLIPMTWAVIQFDSHYDSLRYMRQILSPHPNQWDQEPAADLAEQV